MNCCDEYGDCRQGRDCPIRKIDDCKFCYGIGYDASGGRCACTIYPFQTQTPRSPSWPTSFNSTVSFLRNLTKKAWSLVRPKRKSS